MRADPHNLSTGRILQDLAERRPLIVGLTGHAYVLTGACFHLDGWGQPLIDRVVLRDPWPFNASRQEMSMGEFLQRAKFATRVLVEPVRVAA